MRSQWESDWGEELGGAGVLRSVLSGQESRGPRERPPPHHCPPAPVRERGRGRGSDWGLAGEAGAPGSMALGKSLGETGRRVGVLLQAGQKQWGWEPREETLCWCQDLRFILFPGRGVSCLWPPPLSRISTTASSLLSGTVIHPCLGTLISCPGDAGTSHGLELKRVFAFRQNPGGEPQNHSTLQEACAGEELYR